MSTYNEYSSRVVQSSTISYKSNGQQRTMNTDQNQRVQNISKQMQIFLMAIELERLTDENSKLKNKIITLEDQQFNNQNLEQQIIDLTNKLHSIEISYQTITYEKSQIEHMNQEFVKFKQINENQETNLRQEVEKLRIKLRDFEQMKQDEIQTIIRQKESETQLLLQTQMHENDLNWQQQKELAEKELLKFKELYYQKQKENDELRISLQQQDLSKYRNMENLLLQQKNDLERQNQTIQQYQFENQELKQRMYNVERIEEELQKLETEHQYANEYIAQLESENQERKQEFDLIQDELEKLRFGLQVKSQDLDDYKAKCLKYERQSLDSTRNRKSLDEKFILMQQEIERLQLILRQKNMEVENISKKITDNSAERKRLAELEYQFKILVQKNQENEKKILESQYKLVEQTKIAQESDKKITELSQKCLKYESIIQEKNQTLQMQEEKYKEIEIRYANLLQELDKINKIIQIKNAENESYKIQIENSKVKLTNYDKQLKELYDQISQLEKDIEKLKRYEENCRVLSAEIDRLNDINQRQEEELKQWRLQYASEGSLNKRIVDQLSILFVLMIEVESLREIINSKDKQIEDIRRQNLAPYKDKKK